ncbi:hypothetical protein BASA61_004620 [Batrachochytrium salamandrivorans]|nr:hypothetical protein BASA61_004620 [Batrachochytrium salamandrivorans]
MPEISGQNNGQTACSNPQATDSSKTGSIHLERRWIPPGIVSSNSDSYHPPPTASLDDFTPDFEDYVAPPNQVSNDGASYAAGYSGYNAGLCGYSAGLQVAQTSGICMVPGVRHHRHRHIRHNNPNAHQASLFRFSGRPTLFHQTGHPAHLHSTRHGGPGRHV